MICDYVCPGDIIIKEPRSKELPIIQYPDECWYCGLCEQACPADAITVVFPEAMLNPQTSIRDLLGRDPD
jgi:NAD-dependent dihydropyrimidine dehydrogenase PreA subunit